MLDIRTVAIPIVLGIASGCAQGAPPPPSPAGVVNTTRVDTVYVRSESEVDAQLEDQIARLQIQLLERDLVIAELRDQLDGTRQELVRNMAKLQGQASRAEAASGMAEAEIALETLGRTTGGRSLPEFAMAEARLAESTREFSEENFEGALYLATEARTLARGAQRRLGSGTGVALQEGESLFAIPVPLQTVSRSNVRSGPGLGFDVRFTIDGGERVEGRSHTSQWVRVADADGREGWIFHTLVTAPGG